MPSHASLLYAVTFYPDTKHNRQARPCAQTHYTLPYLTLKQKYINFIIPDINKIPSDNKKMCANTHLYLHCEITHVSLHALW